MPQSYLIIYPVGKKKQNFLDKRKVVYSYDKSYCMAKKSKNYKIEEEDIKKFMVEEPFLEYKTIKKLPVVADYTYKKFEKLSSMVPFTQKEWAGILDLSERTLQRYARDNKGFEGIYTDRLLHIEQLIEAGLETFISAAAFYAWLKKDKFVLGQPLTFENLYTTRGIQETINQLLRIQQGVYS